MAASVEQTPRFARLLRKLRLSPAEREIVNAALANPFEPHLDAKKLRPCRGYPAGSNAWRIKVFNQDYRAIFLRQADTLVWDWIGTHEDYNRVVG